MGERAFDLAAFYARAARTEKERSALRQDLVRGLKEYYETIYGYDRYGAETIFQLSDRLGVPFIYGFAMLRVLRDRRISPEGKCAAARGAIDAIAYGEDQGLPYGLFAALDYLASEGALSTDDLRYALVASAGELNLFRGTERGTPAHFIHWLLSNNDLPATERLFWAHSLAARHQEQTGAVEMVNAVAGHRDVPAEGRAELCRAWVHFRQPRITVEIPAESSDPRSAFVAEHMPFWVAHAPSWPTATMVRLGLIWLARLTDPLAVAQSYLDQRTGYAEQIHAAVADILAEHHAVIAPDVLAALIDHGARTGGTSGRRKFYRLGAELFGDTYLERAREDTAGSLRRWAAQQLGHDQ